MRKKIAVLPVTGGLFGWFALSLFLFLSASSSNSASRLTKAAPTSLNSGPDAIVGDISSLQQFGSFGTQVGLAIGTSICNGGNMLLNFFALPNTNHPVLAQNLYRMDGGPAHTDRFEQIGQSWVAHAFFALQSNSCSFGCTPAPDGTHLGAGCSTADSASIHAGPPYLGSRAWVNPLTGIFPSTAADHSGHSHTGTSHRILVEAADLSNVSNGTATYFAEGQLVAADEYLWCEAHPGECNMSNNVSYRQFNVTGTTSFVFSAIGSTVRMAPAINAWPGATVRTIEPAPGIDGQAFLAYKVTGPVGGLYHYEYAIYNQNLDRGIQSFSVPRLLIPSAGEGVFPEQNVGFHAPPQHPGFANDGTQGDAGFSGAEWTFTASAANLTWSSETFAQNPNANAVRWGTLYNFRFDSTTPPVTSNATIGFFKTGAPIMVEAQGPAPTGGPSPTPVPTPLPCGVAFAENFDAVTAPALPAGWVAAFNPGPSSCKSGGTCLQGSNWVTSTTVPQTPPNAAFHDDPSCVTDSTLDTPTIPISFGAFLSFQQNYDLEATFDGGVLEISINGGPFTDIITAGGSFQSGGYDGPISTGFLSPIAGRPAWTGNSGGYMNTIVRLPDSANTNNVVLRFRLATDCSGSGMGWLIDTMLVTEIGPCPTPSPPPSPPPPTPTPALVRVSGTISYCSNPVPGPVPNVTLSLTGGASGSTLSDGSGNYQFSSLASGGSYTVTPSKAARTPGSAGINTVDVIATQRHFLILGTPLSGCQLTAADVNGDTSINTVDVIAIQRFFLGLPNGIAHTGNYQFSPAHRDYPGVVADQTGQNYNTLIFGDVASPFAEP